MLEELDSTTKSEARQRVKDATEEAQRIIETANHQADRRIAYSKELAEELRVLRGRVLAQLLGIRGQLDSVPAMLASVNREAELLDSSPSARRIGANFAALEASDAEVEVLDATDLTAAVELTEAGDFAPDAVDADAVDADEAGAKDSVAKEASADADSVDEGDAQKRTNGRASAQSGR
jgi:hypothetical protein